MGKLSSREYKEKRNNTVAYTEIETYLGGVIFRLWFKIPLH